MSSSTNRWKISWACNVVGLLKVGGEKGTPSSKMQPVEEGDISMRGEWEAGWGGRQWYGEVGAHKAHKSSALFFFLDDGWFLLGGRRRHAHKRVV